MKLTGTGFRRAATRSNAADDFVREVNENIAGLGERFGLHEETLELMCECGVPGCAERIRVPADEYGRLAAAGRRIVVPGHDHGRSFRQRDGYVVLAD